MSVCWCPKSLDNFLLVHSNELALYHLTKTSPYKSVSDSKHLRNIDLHSCVDLPVSDDFAATLLARNDEIPYTIKCYDVYPGQGLQHQNIVALGYANGRVALASPYLSLVDDSWLGKELVPRHSRPCNTLRWNHAEPNLLAVGLDKYRSDNSVLIWDLNSKSDFSTSTAATSSVAVNLITSATDHLFNITNNGFGPMEPRKHVYSIDQREGAMSSSTIGALPTVQSKASYETAPSETTLSLLWMRQNPRIIAVGLSHKYIRIFDLRDFGRPQTSIQTKACYGLSLDPCNDQRLCSFNENQLMLWDLRYPEKPLLSITEPRSLLKVQWDPVKRHIFASISKDSSSIRVYHLEHIVIADQAEISYTENVVQPKLLNVTSSGLPTVTLTSFDFHPTDDNRIIFSRFDGLPAYTTLCLRLPIKWNASSQQCKILCAFPKSLLECHAMRHSREPKPNGDALTNRSPNKLQNDIYYKMKKRVKLKYGLTGSVEKSAPSLPSVSSIFHKCAEICVEDGDVDLAQVWSWMEKVRMLADEEADAWPYFTKYPGALNILQSSGVKSSSALEYRSMFGIDSSGHTLSATKFFVSAERDRILQLCGWGGMAKERFPANDSAIQKLVVDEQFERAAAISLFTHRLKLASHILLNAGPIAKSKNLQMVSLALAGFPNSSDKESFMSGSTTQLNSPSFWLEMCNAVLASVDNPHLKAAFRFLSCKCSGSVTYDAVLEMDDLPVLDKIAFAAVHLPDVLLIDYLKRTYDKCLESANLVGLLISGFCNEEGLNLIGSYLDLTSDVQSSALLLILSESYVQQASSAESASGGRASNSASIGLCALMNGLDTSPKNNDVTDALDAQAFGGRLCEQILASYFDLLDRWHFWHARAETESILALQIDPTKASVYPRRVPPQVSLTCTFCSKPIWSTAGRSRQRLIRPSSCPSCKKPLPRCSLCRIHMGTPLFSSSDKVNKFDTWFSWCQTCRHGGHSGHLADWFEANTECPVTGCTCLCSSLDPNE